MPDKFQLELEEALKKRKSVTEDDVGDIDTKDGDDFVNSFIKPKVTIQNSTIFMQSNLLNNFSHQGEEVSLLKQQKVRWTWMTIFLV